jgi:MFS transporter, DHA2 family, multidrug resistance protein
MEGMQLTSIAGAVLMLLASVLAYKSLKHLRTAH